MIPYATPLSHLANPTTAGRLPPNGNGATRQLSPATRFDALTTALSWVLCIMVAFLFVVVSANCRHWFIVPLVLCGVVISHDLINWLRGRLDFLDPVGLIGMLGFYFFFVTPFLHVAWDWWLVDPDLRPEDARPWLGWMGGLNLMGLLIYRYLRDPFAGSFRGTARKIWLVNSSIFWPCLLVLLIVAAVLQALVYANWGGIGGYIHAVETSLQASFSDTSMLSMFSECFPILLMMGYAMLARRSAFLSSWLALAVVMLLFFLIAMLFGGLRGSRSNTVFALFWGAGIIHFFVRRLSIKVGIIGIIFVLAFMYVYGFYKTAGLNAFRALQGGAGLEYLEQKTRRSTEALLLADLSRAELQAFILRQMFNEQLDYDLSYGRTYMATACLLIPRFVWADRPQLKAQEGTEIQYGKGSYHPTRWKSSFVYGISGEAMMNFGPIGVPIIFAIWTFAVARVRKWITTWDSRDVRLMLAPFLVNLCVISLASDSDNILFVMLKNGTVPMLFVWFSSRHLSFRSASATSRLLRPTNRYATAHI